MSTLISAVTTALPFTKRWCDALSNGAADRMPWIVQSLKSNVWRMYYRAATVAEANAMATGLRNAQGKSPHLHAIRVINEKTGEHGISLGNLYHKGKEGKEDKESKESTPAKKERKK
ncbi:MAG: hypothetical protein ISN29_05290 [Gammaproteobacteria bacterium AqS3]|nr:hypothetical protein [Gammaproteobacteria bacterium AqS3]